MNGIDLQCLEKPAKPMGFGTFPAKPLADEDGIDGWMALGLLRR